MMNNKKMYFKVENIEQKRALEGLAYHIADANYIKERYGSDDPEYDKVNKNILLSFDILDALSVPFWVQNSVICFAEDWRRYKQVYIDQWLLNNRNIDINIY